MSDTYLKKRIAVFGSTGSIGTQALDVIRSNPALFETEILTAQNNAELLIQQALEFNPNAIVIGDESKYKMVQEALSKTSIKVFAGEAALEEVADFDTYDVMLAGIVSESIPFYIGTDLFIGIPERHTLQHQFVYFFHTEEVFILFIGQDILLHFDISKHQ